MALLRRESPNNIIPPPGGIAEVKSSNRPSWLALAVYVLGALVVAILLVFGGRWIYRSVTNNSPASPSPAPISQNYPSQSTQQPQPSPTPTPSPSKSPSPSPSPSKSPTTPASPGKSPSPSPSPTQLPSNGPGEVIALFIGTSAVAAWLHYKITSKRQAN